MAFIKMHGLGNDFVIIDGRGDAPALSPAQVQNVADRRLGVGCDQLIRLEAPADGRAHLFIRILNADGSEAEACGNAARCVAQRAMAETGTESVMLETAAGLIEARAGADGAITVDMGPPALDWRDIPLASEADTLELDIQAGPLRGPSAVGMGNPHMVFFVDAAEAIDLDALGPELEHHPIYPNRANVEVVAVTAPGRLRMRVWERGVGITPACGSGACAALVAAHRRGLAGRRAEVTLDGGTLVIQWRDADGHVELTGPVATAFSGVLELGDLP